MPTLELDHVSMTVRTSRAQPSLRAPRDLPDLARFLLTSLARGQDESIKALTDLALGFDAGCLAILGEEGAGKTSLVALFGRVLEPTEGAVRLRGVDIHTARGKAGLEVRRGLQVILDDIDGGLDPRLSVRRSLALYARALKLAVDDNTMGDALKSVALDAAVLDRAAQDLSRGEVKRVALARALLAQPDVIVIDEPTRGLDPLERTAVAQVLARLVSRGCLVVATRDVALARVIATRVAVLSQGELIEYDEADRIFFAPGHDITRKLMSAAPVRVRRTAIS